jgi:hypothetical protein
LNAVFVFADRDDLEEEDLGEEDDLVFFLFCFFGILGRSVGGTSLNMSKLGWCLMDSSKSVTRHRKYKVNGEPP